MVKWWRSELHCLVLSVAAPVRVVSDTTHMALFEVGDFCKFNSLDGRPVFAMLICTSDDQRQKVADPFDCGMGFGSTVA